MRPTLSTRPQGTQWGRPFAYKTADARSARHRDRLLTPTTDARQAKGVLDGEGSRAWWTKRWSSG